MTLATIDNKPKASDIPLETRAMAARHGGLEAYAKAVHNMELEPYQLSWEAGLDTGNRLVIVCPPDTFKSTTVQFWVERQIGLNPEIRILWLMNSGDQAAKRVMTISSTLKSNNVYRKAFPNIKEDRDAMWTKTVLFVKREREDPNPTLMGSGVNGPYQGQHFDVIIIDDMTNQEDVRSGNEMALQVSKLRGVISDRLVDGGRMVSILTRWGENDLVPTFEEMGFRIIEMPILGNYPWGESLSPKHWPLRRIEAKRIEKTDAIFNLTFMCNPLGMEDGIIKQSSIKYWNRDNLPNRPLLAVMAVDPASSTKSWADPSCVGVALLDTKTRAIYVTDLWTGRLEVDDLENEIVKRGLRTSKLVAIGLETIGFQLSMLQRLRRKYRNLPFRELQYRTKRQILMKAGGLDKSKIGRAVYIESKFLSNQIFLPDPEEQKLINVDGVSIESELCRFPTPGLHDDRLDVISFMSAIGDSYSSRNIKFKIKRGSR